MSGDVIIRHLAEHLRPEYVVFLVSFGRLVNSIDLLLHAPKIGLFTLHCRCLTLFHACFPINVIYKTDVSGVYDRPPTDPNAVLLREIGEPLPINCKPDTCINLDGYDNIRVYISR